VSHRALSIEIPAAGSYLRLVRMLVSAFAAEAAGLDVEAAARVRLAASEACVALLGTDPDAGHVPMRVHAQVEPGWVDLEVRMATPSPVHEQALAVIRVLADVVDARTDAGDQVVHVRLHHTVGGRAAAGV